MSVVKEGFDLYFLQMGLEPATRQKKRHVWGGDTGTASERFTEAVRPVVQTVHGRADGPEEGQGRTLEGPASLRARECIQRDSRRVQRGLPQGRGQESEWGRVLLACCVWTFTSHLRPAGNILGLYVWDVQDGRTVSQLEIFKSKFCFVNMFEPASERVYIHHS